VSPVAPWRVVVAGGGVAGVEALLGLRDLGEGALDLALVTPGLHFVLRPYAVAEPFGGAPSPSLPYADIAREQGARFVRDRVGGVRAGDRMLDLEQAGELPYDALVLAVGAQSRPFHPAAISFDGPAAVPAVRRLLGDLTRGRAQSVALVVPAGVTWALPMYELALMLRGRARQRRVLLISSEPSPLAVFGPEPSRAIGEMLARAGVELFVGADPQIVDEGTAVGLSADGRRLPVDRIIAPALLEGPRLPGVPHDDDGFILVDEYGRVPGLDRVYAAGDGTDFAVKQGGLAAQQADAAVRHLVAEAGGLLAAEPFRPVLRGRLVTGGLDRYLRHDPEGEDLLLDVPLWEPAAKVVGHHLAPWLAYRHPTRRAVRADVEPVGVDRELGLEPLGHIGPVVPAVRGLDLPPRGTGG
jgi:sulfide:quinone oxidoreductase